MSRVTRQTLWQQLHEAKLVDGECPAVVEQESPWYVRVMLGAAGWLGSFFLLGFVGIGFSFVMESAFASLLIGALLTVVAFFLFRAHAANDFLAQLGLAVSLAGQMLIIYGFFEWSDHNEFRLFSVLCVVEILLMLCMPNFIYRVMSCVAAAMSLSFALWEVGILGVTQGLTAAGFAVLWLQDIRWARFSQVLRPIGYGLVLSLLVYRTGTLWGGGLWRFYSHNRTTMLLVYSPWVGMTLVAAVLLAVVLVLLRRSQVELTSRAGVAVLVGTLLATGITWNAQGITLALLILIVGFAVSNRVLVGCGLVAFAGFLSWYYYSMETTLLVKSMLLFGFGAVLLVGRMALNKWLPRPMAGEVADA